MEVENKAPKGIASRPRGGVGRPRIDIQRMARALQGPGNDTRFWISAGTVGSKDDDGEFTTKDLEDIYVDQDGAVVSVRLEPSGKVITARWSGVSCGRFGFILVPCRPGDEVIVLFPDGDLNSPAASIIYLQSNRTAQIPSDWNNDRVLIDLNVPLDIRAPAVRIRSGSLDLNDRTVTWSPEDI